MEQPSQAEKDALEKANEAADASQAAWDELNAIENATVQDIEKWIAARDRAHVVQDYYIALIRHRKFREPYPRPL
jgi:hypothetical protein